MTAPRLPLHPSMRHPLTGQPLRAIALHPKTGRPVWPIMGGDDTVPPSDTPPADAPPADQPPADTPPAPPANPPADLGFPPNTPVAEMTLEQQVAYHKHQARKHETRASEYRQALGGKTAAEAQAELEQLRRDKMTAEERAIEDAKRQARDEATREYAPQSVRTAFDLLLGDMPEEERNAEIELLDLSKFLTSSGAVDTAKVRRAAERIAHTDKGSGNGQQFDFGAGRRGGTQPDAGVSAGASRYAARKQKSAPST